MASPEILVIHIMKTAGTSLRRMLVDGVGAEAIYPNDEDLHERRKGWYPNPGAYPEHVREGRHHGARVLIGHVPYVLADEFEPRPQTVTLLREPVARAVSMLEHRRTRSKRFHGATYEDILADDEVVACHIRDYQTKMFAFDTLAEYRRTVNAPLEIDDARFERALQRLEAVDALGVVERMDEARRAVAAVTGGPVGEEQRANRGRYDRDALSPGVRERLEELTARDAAFYRRALELVDQRAGDTGSPGRRGLLSRLVGQRRR